jgi:hypothetical protein
VSGSGLLAGFRVAYDKEARGEYYIWLRAVLVTADAELLPYECDPIPVCVGGDCKPTSPPDAESLRELSIPVPGDGPIYCDVNGDGSVNVLDLILVREMLNMSSGEPDGLFHDRRRYADLNYPPDGTINVLDLIAV